jgi:hypothetical protein
MISPTRLRDFLHYDAETGAFTWLRDGRNQAQRAGAPAAASVHQGYRRICIDGVRYLAHRLAWIYVHGEEPIGVIDHINGDGTDNRIANLRPCTQAENLRNSKVSANNRLGLKGVRQLRHGKYQARIRYDGRSVHLGVFESAEAAAAAYDVAAKAHHGEFARPNGVAV